MSFLRKAITSLNLSAESALRRAELARIESSEALCKAFGFRDENGEPLKGLEAVNAAKEISDYICKL